MLLVLLAIILGLVSHAPSAEAQTTQNPSGPMPDLSGMAWMGGDLFLTVHDAKNPDELERPRVSLMSLPTSLEGVAWHPLNLTFPGEKSSDLESASRIPGTTKVLLAESTDNGSAFDRIFLVEVNDGAADVVAVTDWNGFTDAHNIEATAAALTGNESTIFVWAERNSGHTSTDINWTTLSIDPFAIGAPVSSARFSLPGSAYGEDGEPRYDRPVVAMDIDSTGQIYVVATFDPEGSSPTPDNGPFRSVIYRAGRIQEGAIVLDGEPEVMATLDGLKVESLAIREHRGGLEFFVGTDDENYGGILRVVPVRAGR